MIMKLVEEQTEAAKNLQNSSAEGAEAFLFWETLFTHFNFFLQPRWKIFWSVTEPLPNKL